jgi:anti-sigma factor RsiW
LNCEEASLLLNPYVDSELDVVHSLEVEEHLKTCAACARAVADHQALRSALQDESLYYRASAPRKLLPPARNYGRIYSMMAIAASLLIAGFLGGRWQPREDRNEQAILDSHLRSLMPGHLEDVVSTDQHTVKPWFNGKLNFSPPVADFAQQGFPLTGGRTDSIAGRDVAALIYQRNKHVINVYVWPSTGPADANADKSTRQGYNEIHWTRGSFEWWVISDLNANELAGFAALLRGATP